MMDNSFAALMSFDSHGKRGRSDSDSSSVEGGRSVKKSVSDNTQILFLTSRDVNLAKVNPLKLNRALTDVIGAVDQVWLLADRVKIRCTKTQANILKHEKRLCGYALTCEIKEMRKIYQKGIIHGVHKDITDNDLVLDLGNTIQKVKRITKFNKDTKNREITGSVVLFFDAESLPERVSLGFQSFKVNTFIPRPIRCFKCQRYGHVASTCRGSRRCPKCGEDHDFTDCTNEVSCCLCGGKHSAAFRGCKMYQDAFEIIKIKSAHNVSYAEDTKQAKAKSLSTTSGSPSSQSSVDDSLPLGQQVKHPSSSDEQFQNQLTQSMSNVQNIVDTVLEQTQSNNLEIFSQITALVIKVVSIAQDQTFWRSDRLTRIKFIAEKANSIFQTTMDPEHILDIYNKIDQ